MKRAIACVGIILYAALTGASSTARQGGVERLNRALVQALEASDLEGIMSLYADDAVLFPPGEKTARGREEIRYRWNSLLRANRVRLCRIQNPTYVTSAALSAGWARVSLALEPRSGKEPVTIEGRFMTVAQKRDRQWLYVFVGISDLDEILTLRHYSGKN